MSTDTNRLPGLKPEPIRMVAGYPVFSDTPASDAFLAICLDDGSTVADCDFCGRTHFTPDYQPSGPEESPYAVLVAQATSKPNGGHIEHPGESDLRLGNVDGKRFVTNCICNGAAVYEAIFWNNRDIAARYCFMRAQIQLEGAQTDMDAVGKMAEAVQQT